MGVVGVGHGQLAGHRFHEIVAGDAALQGIVRDDVRLRALARELYAAGGDDVGHLHIAHQSCHVVGVVGVAEPVIDKVRVAGRDGDGVGYNSQRSGNVGVHCVVAAHVVAVMRQRVAHDGVGHARGAVVRNPAVRVECDGQHVAVAERIDAVGGDGHRHRLVRADRQIVAVQRVRVGVEHPGGVAGGERQLNRLAVNHCQFAVCIGDGIVGRNALAGVARCEGMSCNRVGLHVFHEGHGAGLREGDIRHVVAGHETVSIDVILVPGLGCTRVGELLRLGREGHRTRIHLELVAAGLCHVVGIGGPHLHLLCRGVGVRDGSRCFAPVVAVQRVLYGHVAVVACRGCGDRVQGIAVIDLEGVCTRRAGQGEAGRGLLDFLPQVIDNRVVVRGNLLAVLHREVARGGHGRL